MSEAENPNLAKTVLDNVSAPALNKNDAHEAIDLITEEPGAPTMTTRARGGAYLQNLSTAWPNLHFDVRQTIAEDGFVWSC